MYKSKLIFCLVFSLVSSTLSMTAHSQNSSVDQTETINQSLTKATYLEKIENIELMIAAYETKINWAKTNPSQDSIAKAEGWYDMMENSFEKARNQIIVSKIEQIQNYYANILDFPFDEIHIQNNAIPEMITERTQLAPNYPTSDEFIPTSEISINALSVWAKEFPMEYHDFTTYLETVVINHLH